MYRAIVRRKLRQAFASLDKGDYEPLLAGAHALGGARPTKPGMRRWFERLHLLLPNLHCTIKHIAVSGLP